jgi:hypothetical protein
MGRGFRPGQNRDKWGARNKERLASRCDLWTYEPCFFESGEDGIVWERSGSRGGEHTIHPARRFAARVHPFVLPSCRGR